MNTVDALTDRHCRNLMCARGWPDNMDIDFNNCGGKVSNVAFYGHLDTNALINMLPEMQKRGYMTDKVAKNLCEVIKDSKFSIELTRRSINSYYVHSGTISLEYGEYPDGMTDKKMHLLLKAFRAEIDDICSSATVDRCRIIDAITPSKSPILLQRMTPNFIVMVKETVPFGHTWNDWNADQLNHWLEIIFFQNAMFKTLEVSVFYREKNSRVGRIWQKDVMILPEQKIRDWFKREWLRDVITDARQKMTDLLASLD